MFAPFRILMWYAPSSSILFFILTIAFQSICCHKTVHYVKVLWISYSNRYSIPLLHRPHINSGETLALTIFADSQGRIPLVIILALALRTSLQGITIFTFQSHSSSIPIHFPKLESLLDSICILRKATVYLCN